MELFILKKNRSRKYDSEDLLRKILLLSGAEGILVRREANGRLMLEARPGGGIPFHVSVSHTARYWVCITDPRGPVGIDIEEKGRTVRPGVLKALHPFEQAYLEGLEEGSADWTDAFLDIWTRKESYVKYLGRGISHGLSTFSVIAETGDPAACVREGSENTAYLWPLSVADGFWAAVCAAHPQEDVTVRYFTDHGCPLKSAEEHTADLLAQKDHTAEELLEKLRRKGHDFPAAQAAVSKAKESGFLDDERFAENYARKAMSRGKGTYRILQELIRKGVPADQARTVLEKISPDMEGDLDRALRQAGALLEKCGEGDGAPVTDRTRARIARRLSALGYETAVVCSVLERLPS